MSMKTSGFSNTILLSLALATLLVTGLVLAEGYDITYEDPEGDVEDLDGQMYAQGYEHIDILEVSSSENFLGSQLILEMTVSGVITDSEDIIYGFTIMDSDEMVYLVSYNNGICSGMNMDDDDTDILQASGSGTSTLEVRVQLNDIGDISEFDFWGNAFEMDEELYLWDYAPDSGPGWYDDDFGYYEVPLMITEPKPGATVSGTKTITGVTSSDYEMVSVEIQFDSESECGLILTSTDDDWET